MTNSAIKVFTSSAANYLPKARLLFESLQRHHPEVERIWAVADLPSVMPTDVEVPFDRMISVADLGIPDWRAWAFGLSLVELSTAIKPIVARRLLDEPGTRGVIFLDPDIVLFSRLDDILAGFDGASVQLTPHQTVPETALDAIIDNEICSLRHGVFNLGFFAVSNDDEARRFLDWWAFRLKHFCHEDLGRHLWTDQKWINLAPCFFERISTLRSPRHNVAPWNLAHRPLREEPDGTLFVADEPLGFYHFTGFDSGAHKHMALKYAGDNPVIHKLIDWYANATAAAPNDPKPRWAFSQFKDGTPIRRLHRLVYRTRPDLQAAFPDPFETTGKSYLAWFRLRFAVDYLRPSRVLRAFAAAWRAFMTALV